MRPLFRSLNTFDLVWFFQLRAANMLPTETWRRSVVDIDDVQSTHQRTILQMGTGPLAARGGNGVFRRGEQWVGERLMEGPMRW